MGGSPSKSVDKVVILEDEGGVDGMGGDFCVALKQNLQRCMLYASSSDPKEQAFVAERLANEAVHRERQAQIVECGGMSLLVPLMRSRDAEVQRLATHALANLSALASNQRTIAEAPGCLEVLFTHLASKFPEVSRQAAKTVANVSVVPEMMRAIAARGGLPPLAALLSSPSAKTRVEAIAAVANLAVDGENEVDLVRLGVFEPLLATMGGGAGGEGGFKPPSDLDTAVQVARAFRNLTARAENAKVLLSMNGMAAVTALLNSGQAAVSQQASIAMDNLKKAR
jgi:hypothetical protein